MSKKVKQLYFVESIAQSLLEEGEIDRCIIYCIPCVEVQMRLSGNLLPAHTQWDDLESEYMLYLVRAVQKYDKTKGSKLFTWIQNYLRFARLTFMSREKLYFEKNVQLQEILE